MAEAISDWVDSLLVGALALVITGILCSLAGLVGAFVLRFRDGPEKPVGHYAALTGWIAGSLFVILVGGFWLLRLTGATFGVGLMRGAG